jgi:hypothetical protein
MKLAIVGSTSLAGNERAAQIIEEVIDRFKPTIIISGGAVGIDSMAEAAAIRRGIEPLIFRPEVHRWDGGERVGFKQRNLHIALMCDVLVRIVADDSRTYGSGWTRDRARGNGAVTEEYVVEHRRLA